MIARDWLHRLSVSIQHKALEVLSLPLEGFQEPARLVSGEAPPLAEVPPTLVVSSHVDGYEGH